MKIYTFSILLLFGAFTCGSMQKTDPPAVHVAQSPEANYRQYCASCHGEELRTFIDRKWVYGNSWNEVYQAIKVGYPKDGMPAYAATFSDKEIGELTDYILTGIEKIKGNQLAEGQTYAGVQQSQHLAYSVETVVEGLDVPWGLDFLPDGTLLVTERSGQLQQWTPDGGLKPVANVPAVRAAGQGGLLDVEVHPDFGKNAWIYLSFSKPHPTDRELSTTAVVRAELRSGALVNVTEVFVAEPYFETRHHYGSRMAFSPTGHLFVSVGDRGNHFLTAQQLDSDCGKIHRLNADGSIPADNPFKDAKGQATSVYSYGHRNPQGIGIHPATGELWEHEHGPRGGDEVNRITAGTNYGWPTISYGINYNGTVLTDKTAQPGMAQPATYWVPSIAPCGMDFVTSDRYPAWRNNLLVGSLRFNYVARCVIEGDKVVEQERITPNVGRVRDIKVGPDGYIYIATEGPGKVVRVVPVG